MQSGSFFRLLALAAVLSGASCDSSGRSGGEPLPPPRHPAMLGGAEGPAGARGAEFSPLGPPKGTVAPEPLPPGHPAIGGAGQKESAGAPEPAAGAAGQDQGRTVSVPPLVLTAPEGWLRRVPTGGQFAPLAEFALPRAEGDPEDGRLTVSYAGGSLEQNVSRWQGQFKENPPAKPEEVEVGGLKGVVVRLQGTLSGGGGPMARGGPEKPNSKLWGAILTLAGEDRKVFLKATGPQKTMDRWDATFLAFLDSLKK